MLRHILQYLWAIVQYVILHSGAMRDICQVQLRMELNTKVAEFLPLHNPYGLKNISEPKKGKKKRKPDQWQQQIAQVHPENCLEWIKGTHASAWQSTETPVTFAKAASPCLPLKAMFCFWQSWAHSSAWWLSRWLQRGPDAVLSLSAVLVAVYFDGNTTCAKFSVNIVCKNMGKVFKKNLTGKLCIPLPHQ